jgi:hypothetical protein
LHTPRFAHFLSLALVSSLPTVTDAVPLLTGFGGPGGYGLPEHCVAAGNDNSYAAGSAEPTPIDLTPAFPAGLPFLGRTLTRFFLNTNGTITFAAPLMTPTATAFPIPGQPMIAAWWADVDTRGGGSVCFHVEPGLVVATWHDVGYFDGRADRRNDFQLLLSARPLCDAAGGINIELRYHRCEWVSGDGAFAPAQVGVDFGNLQNFIALPQSRTSAIADVCRTTNVPGGPAGLYRFPLFSALPRCGEGYPCTVPGRAGRCAQGATRCDGDEQVCAQVHTPAPPGCGRVDEDCDGESDDSDAACGEGRLCDRYACAARCAPDGRCPAGLACTPGGACVEAACAAVRCPDGQRCAGGRCVDLCDGIVCGPAQACRDGECRDLCLPISCTPDLCDVDPSSPTLGSCIRRCECEPCPDGRTCGPDGRCAPRSPPPVDAGAVADLGSLPSVRDAPDGAAPLDASAPSSGRLVDGGCGCRAGSTPPVRQAVSVLALMAGILLRRQRRLFIVSAPPARPRRRSRRPLPTR